MGSTAPRAASACMAWKRAKRFKPLRLLRYRVSRQPARLLVLRIGDRERPQQHPLHLSQGRGANLDVIPTPQRRLPQFLAQHGRIDAQLLRGVHGKLVAHELFAECDGCAAAGSSSP